MTEPAATAREHPPGTCRARGAEGLCRTCAAAFLGGSTSWFDEGPRKELPFVRHGGKLTWLLDDLRAWQLAHREVPPSPASHQDRAHGSAKTAPSSGPGRPSPAAPGTPPRPSSSAAAIEKRLTEKLQRCISRNAAAAESGAEVLPFPGKSSAP